MQHLSRTMIIEQITVTLFQQHTRLVGCEETGQAICIDPGDDAPTIAARLRRHGFQLQAITLTHGHMDHVGGTTDLKRLFPAAEIIIHPDDEMLYRNLPLQPAALGMPRERWADYGFAYEDPPAPDRYWQDGEVYQVGNLAFKVLHCPGHTPGHVILCEERERKAFVGDCLFAGSVGRTDLPGGSSAQLMDSLHNKILPLGDDVEVYSGHGPVTTIGRERATNPFLNGAHAIGRYL